jgi:adenine/guanine/hypoxanthine permease
MILLKRFDIARRGSTVQREILAGLTTYVTMAYITIVNPAILTAAGMPREASTTVTIVVAVVGTLLMGLFANRPFAVAPLMGENAFVAYTMVTVMGYSWQMAMGAVFLSGILFIVLTLAGARSYLAEAIPLSLKHSFAAGIGLFLAFIGLLDMGVVVPGTGGMPLKLGAVSSPMVMLSIGGFVVIVVLQMWKFRAAMLAGIAAVILAGIGLGYLAPPESYIGLPSSMAPLAFQLDIRGVLSIAALPVIFTVFVMAFVDTLGSLFGLSARAGLLDEKGNLPEIQKPMLVDAVATTLAGILGTATTGAYIESAAGIEAGGRTGLTAVVVAVLFLLSLFLTPLVAFVPAIAYAPCLVIVGFMMAQSIRHIPVTDPSEFIPAFLTMVLMVFTFNIGIGMTVGFIAYPLLKSLSGKAREVTPGMWFLGALSVAFYAVAPLR